MRIFAAAFSATVFASLCGGTSVTLAQTRAEVRVAEESVVDSDRILLGTVSSISGDSAVVERLSRISLGYAPNIGTTREIRREQIVMAAASAGFSNNEVLVTAPATVRVTRSAGSVSASDVREAVETSILTKFSDCGIEAKLTRLDLPADFAVPKGKVELRANLTGVRNLFASFSLPIEVRVDGKIVRTFAVMAEIEAYAYVLTLLRAVSAGSPVTDKDVRPEKIRLELPITNYVRDPARVRGVALTRDLEKGAPLTADLLALTTVIKSGDPVRIEAASGTLKIIAAGEARSAGRIGDRIAVKNTQTGTILQAFVTDKGVVKIAF